MQYYLNAERKKALKHDLCSAERKSNEQCLNFTFVLDLNPLIMHL